MTAREEIEDVVREATLDLARLAGALFERRP